jgi:hypothetical protein
VGKRKGKWIKRTRRVKAKRKSKLNRRRKGEIKTKIAHEGQILAYLGKGKIRNFGGGGGILLRTKN